MSRRARIVAAAAVLALIAGGCADAGDSPACIVQAVAGSTVYPIATVHGASPPERAQAFVDLVTGSEGRRVLAAHGFSAP